MNSGKIIQLFPISVFETNIGVDEDIKDFLINQEFELMPSKNGSFTKDRYILNRDDCKDLKEKIFKALNYYVREYLTVQKDINFYLQNSWVNMHKTDDSGQSHIHANSLISGVYYIQTFEDSGNIIFHKPDGYTNLFHTSTNIRFEKYDNHNADRFIIKPKDGTLLFFPSHLLHSIEKNLNKQKRYSMGFNFFAEGELYSRDSNIDYLNLRR